MDLFQDLSLLILCYLSTILDKPFIPFYAREKQSLDTPNAFDKILHHFLTFAPTPFNMTP